MVDMDPGRKAVYIQSSEIHKATQQYAFMPDPLSPEYTNVRLVTYVELRDWRRALEPVLAGQ